MARGNKTNKHLKGMMAGLVMMYAGLGLAAGLVVFVFAAFMGAISGQWATANSASMALGMALIWSVILAISGLTVMVINWIRGVIMLGRAGLTKLVMWEIGLFFAGVLFTCITGGGSFFIPAVWFFVHAGFMEKLDGPKDNKPKDNRQENNRQDLYTLGEVDSKRKPEKQDLYSLGEVK